MAGVGSLMRRLMMGARGLLVLLGLSLAASATSQVSRIDLPLGDGADPYAAPVARMVSSIVEYSRWPDARQNVRLCVVGPVDHADLLNDGPLSRGRTLRATRISAGSVSAANCDAVYLGRMGLTDQRQIATSLMGAAVLTIAENDPACRSRAMICLLFESSGLSFRINLDSVSRSQVRIDPRVLRMGEGGKRPS